MRCLMCESLSLEHICPSCQKIFLTPSLYRRKILNDIEVISFYKYGEIKDLLHTKHTDLGYYVYNILAKNSFSKFAAEFEYLHKVVSIGVDDHTKNGYSHTAILNKALKSKYINPIYGKLRAENSVMYSGKSREFRISNPKEFKLKDFNADEVILVDDIITTNSTLTQAAQALHAKSKEVLFCLTLSDASLK